MDAESPREDGARADGKETSRKKAKEPFGEFTEEMHKRSVALSGTSQRRGH
jgi:hypothetical protein